jgi:uncharacterized protein YuzE
MKIQNKVKTKKEGCNKDVKRGRTIREENLYDREKKMDKWMFNKLRPRAYYDEEFDMLTICFNGERKIEHTIDTHTVEGQTIRFDFDKNNHIVGVEIEDLVQGGKNGKKK